MINIDPFVSSVSAGALGLTSEQEAALAEAARPVRAALMASQLGVTEEEGLRRLAAAAGCGFAALVHPDEAELERLPARLLSDFHAVPVPWPAGEEEPGRVRLATVWLAEPHYADWVYAVAGRDPVWVLTPAEPLIAFLTSRFGVGFSSLDASGAAEEAVEAEDVPEDGDAAVIRFVNELVQQAIADEATDIHLEPQEKALRIRYRIDGILVNVPMPENLRAFQEAIISRLKIMAHLNISERRLPQDGRINFKTPNGLAIDIRISTIPTLYAESVSLRLLNNKREPLSFSQLGLLADQQALIDKVLAYPHGIVLATGPTGSGKSTSLNSFLSRINSPDKRIITVEDPVEYEVPGVNQMQVRPEIGLDFAGALRHILRQDPDVIMVGEIRDRETADMAIRASLTGHLVFSTLHTNDAAGALTRLVDMGIEPFLVASAVELVIAQRLVRRLCPVCRAWRPFARHKLQDHLRTLEIADPEAEVARLLVERPGVDGEPLLAAPVGCARCRNLGFRGRVAIFEILRIDEALHDLILVRESARRLTSTARAAGMRTLQQSGWEAVKLATTTVDEVISATAMEA